MSYINSNLLSDETVVKQAKVHWSVYLSAIALTIVFMLLMMKYFNLSLLILFFLPFVWLSAFINQFSTELAVTNKRLIAKQGLISRRTVELNLDKVESLVVDQGVIGRMFNCGTLTVNGTGGIRAPFKAIDDPLSFRKAVNEQVALSRDAMGVKVF